MDYVNILLLAVVQGLTEFLPVSSSGHLILIPVVMGFKDQGLALDAILHLGTLLAIILYFGNDLWDLYTSPFRQNAPLEKKRLAGWVLVASVPAGFAGLLGGDWIESELRSPYFVAGNLILWSGVFWAADQFSKRQSHPLPNFHGLRLSSILFIGLAQALALLPGTSRSGVTIAAGFFTRLSKEEAARFSFLLGTPIILAAGLYKLMFILNSQDGYNYTAPQLALGFGVTFLVGYVSIKILMEIVARTGLMPFIIYRLALAAGILAFL
ncbi:MAG: hypothetical protein COV67_09415 [Nitrospinae bacterium CG11_big_fil_rev_8_21_14_0_20_56_8]|nr:MAG: hypothetical protein COV67_09415 [Nitrospinae bacterium CG11_big_fil_rev_8_21_14_0_20_56_8]